MHKLVSILVLLQSLSVICQNNIDLSYYLPQNVSYNASIPTPKSIIGHEIGEWHVSHDKLVFYLNMLAEKSDRITIENRGETFEGRPLLLLTLSHKKNLNNLDQIRSEHIKATENDKKPDISKMPLVVYLGYSIHGNESSGSNAALLLAYYLAAAQGDDIENLLENTVILLDPCLNPDGLQRFAYWVNTNKSINLNPDPNDREFSEVWPGARTNHYWFDMNRDWLPVQLPESRVRIKSFHKWLPNILTDHHEMGTYSTFFFQPGIPSRTHPLTPKLNQELTAKIGNYHAAALDKIGSLYFTEESYDDFYYGKGSTFPDINGSIGILFEQASSRGHSQESENGILTFPFTIRNQFTTSLSTLKAGFEMREDLLQYQYDFFKNARNESLKQNNKAIVFGDEKDAAKTYHLAEILKRHNIKLHDIKKDFSVGNKNFKKGYSYMVPKNQKNSRLIKAMFEKRTTFQDSLFYDISAWTLPLAFGLDYVDNVPTSNLGNEIINLRLNEGNVSGKSNYAYLMQWHEYYAPKLLNTLLSKGIRAKVALKQFSLNDVNYDYGTILIPVQNQKLDTNSLFEFLDQQAKECHLTINAVSTGLTQGIDLGSRNFKTLKKPEIALIVGAGIRSYDAGEIWHLFDTRYNMKITKLDTKSIGAADLSRYTTIIIPSISNLGKTETEKLRSWTKDGGTIIGFRSTVKWLEKQEFLKAKFKKINIPVKNVNFEDKRNFSGAQRIGGAIFETKLDRSHPINFGYKNDKLAMFRNTTVFMEADSLSYNNPIEYTKSPLLSGYISKPNLKALARTVPLKINNFGKGKVVAFTDNTNFRGFWYGTNKLLMNVIFFREEL